MRKINIITMGKKNKAGERDDIYHNTQTNGTNSLEKNEKKNNRPN